MCVCYGEDGKRVARVNVHGKLDEEDELIFQVCVWSEGDRITTSKAHCRSAGV